MVAMHHSKTMSQMEGKLFNEMKNAGYKWGGRREGSGPITWAFTLTLSQADPFGYIIYKEVKESKSMYLELSVP